MSDFGILIDPDGSTLLVEPGSEMLWMSPDEIKLPPQRVLHVPAKARVMPVQPRQGIWVPRAVFIGLSPAPRFWPPSYCHQRVAGVAAGAAESRAAPGTPAGPRRG
jgi:hypothetical protein